jgi:signal transduction histidine kinase
VRVVDAVALARGVVEEFASAPGPRAARVLLEAAETPLPIAVDPDQVAGALREIVRNGVEACSRADGGTVRVLVQALATDTAVRLLIIDDGPGMPPQVRARAFDPFYCGMETGSNRGLGLPKAYRAVQASGGQMTLESALDQGTTVRVTFPAAAGADAGTDADAAGWTTGKARKERNTLG